LKCASVTRRSGMESAPRLAEREGISKHEEDVLTSPVDVVDRPRRDVQDAVGQLGGRLACPGVSEFARRIMPPKPATTGTHPDLSQMGAAIPGPPMVRIARLEGGFEHHGEG